MQYRGCVGYETIGNPNITNGILVNSSSSNFIQTTSAVTNSDITEMVWKIYISDSLISADKSCFAFYGGGAIQLGIYPSNGNVLLSIYLPGYGSALIDACAVNATYWIKYIFDGTNVKLYLSTNGTNYVLKNTVTTIPTGSGIIKIGARWQNDTSAVNFYGSIDLNETYIKVNGKLWFWQPRQTSYLIKDGKLMWADSRVFLRSTGSQYINTGIKATQETRVFFKAANESTSEAFFYGARTSYGSYDKHCWNIHTESYYPQFCHHSHAYSYTYVTGTPQVIENGKNGGYINGTQQVTYEYENFSCPYNLYLFGLNESNSLEYRTLHGKIYYFKIYEGNTLVRHFVPVPTGLQIGNFTVPSNGMFDLVNQQFYANEGTGNFTWSKDQ